MDASMDSATSENSRFDDVIVGEEQLREAQRTTIRRVSWGIAWAVPVISLMVGIWLTAAGQIEQLTPAGDGVYDVTWLAVWPAGLVLLAAGTLGIIGAALTTAALATKR